MPDLDAYILARLPSAEFSKRVHEVLGSEKKGKGLREGDMYETILSTVLGRLPS